MADEAAVFDAGLGHRYFSAEAFNRVWELMEKEGRSVGEDEEMVMAAWASLWHWMKRPDVMEKNLSVGHWQLSRVYAVLGRGEEALRHGEESLRHAGGAGVRDFYVGYAHEAIARAARILGRRELMEKHVAEGRRIAAGIADAEERTTLEGDLNAVLRDAG